MPKPLRFHIPRRFHPAYSLLGRLIRRLVPDHRQAEAYAILALTGLALAWLVGQYVAWALFQPALAAEPGGPLALAFWGAQAGGLLALFLVGACGFKPAATVTCAPEGLRLRQGTRALRLPYEAVASAERITPLRFHRHERRYAATHVFAGRLGPGHLLLLRTARGPVVLGLAPADQDALCAHLQRRAFDVPAAPPFAETRSQ